mgnify:CR=1 FL=1
MDYATHPRLPEILKEWHEAGRTTFEQQFKALDYDAHSPKRALVKRKYVCLDEDSGGVWLLDRGTGEIYHIKSAYGVPDKRKHLGHLETVTGADLHRLRWWYLK